MENKPNQHAVVLSEKWKVHCLAFVRGRFFTRSIFIHRVKTRGYLLVHRYKVFTNPEGLYVYRKTSMNIKYDSGGVEPIPTSFFYKHLMPRASGMHSR